MTKEERINLNKRKYAVYAQYRERKKVTDHYISQALSIPASTIYDWRYGLSCPRTETLMLLCDYLDMPMTAVVFGEPKDG